MSDPLDQLERLAPLVDDHAALAAFSSERARRRRRRHALVAAAAALVAVVSAAAFMGVLDSRDETVVATGDQRARRPLGAFVLPAEPPGPLIEAQLWESDGEFSASLQFGPGSACAGGVQSWIYVHSPARPPDSHDDDRAPSGFGPLQETTIICDGIGLGPSSEFIAFTTVAYQGGRSYVVRGSGSAREVAELADNLMSVSRDEWIDFARTAPSRRSEPPETLGE